MRRRGRISSGRRLRALPRVVGSLLTLSAVALLWGCGSHSRRREEAPRIAGRLALDGGTIIDPRDGRHMSGMSVLIDGGRIVAVVPAAATWHDAKVVHVDATGEFIIPGLLDMHAHPLNLTDPSDELELMLANGTTGFRQMSGSSDLLAARRAGTLGMPQDAPELLAMPGEILTPLNANSPRAAVAEVDRQKKQGADFIKMIQTTPATFFAAQAEATRVGLTMVGHLPEGVDVIAASRAGMRSIEHLGPGDGMLVPCSRDEVGLRWTIAKTPSVQGPPFRLPKFVRGMLGRAFEKKVVNPLVSFSGNAGILRHAIDTYDEARCRRLAAILVADHTWQVPTLIRLRTMELGDAKEYARNPNLAYMPRKTVKRWNATASEFAKLPASTRTTYRDLYALQLRLVKLFDQAGVGMMAGSDLGGGWLVPGFSLYDDFDQLSAAGLSPLTILRMATLNGAVFLGRTATMGRVAPGRDANLVLLDRDPSVSVAALHRVHSVVRGGVFYSAADLRRIKDRVRTDAASS